MKTSTAFCKQWRLVRLLPRKGIKQSVQHQVRHLTHVPTILKLAQILRKMLPADVNVGSVDPALELSSEAFQSIDASAARLGILAPRVVHGDVPIAGQGDAL